MQKEFRYFTKMKLIQANKRSIKAGRNRNLTENFVRSLPSHILFPIIMRLLHNDRELRLCVVFDEHGNTGFLDVSMEEYEQLPRIML